MKKLGIVFSIIMLCGLFSCKHKEGEYHSLKEKIEEEGKHYQDPGISSEAYIGDINTIEITEGGHTFLIPERKGQIKSFACTECHSKSLAQLQKGPKEPKAHWDIKLNHANANAMNCATCHNGTNMDNLHSLTGNTIDFNQSYQLCAQCHSAQFEDWKGGAHGKNIGGWAEPRAAMTCINCHNPHRPQIGSKWPVRFNTEKENERK
ncbi:cytochrome c3 family protein [Flagellimonas myxillae]|uniref:cytochrome c3 family protein n=1 Tax=Flagellimonas myxillae TaxID=2942214 RepID=UPI00201E8A28|nr:cytochrome c3 family protein [Muricauda myxillae]MCL6265436.1 cytochrome C [Muricauda myxillae]